MTARTVVESMSGATLSISASLPATYDEAGYNTTDMMYTPVGQIESHGAHGGSANVTKFTPVDTATVNKTKGSKDYGTKQLTIGNLPSDAGQVILAAALESNAHYSVQVQYQDGALHFLDVIVTAFSYQNGAVDDIEKVTCTLEICRKPVIIPGS